LLERAASFGATSILELKVGFLELSVQHTHPTSLSLVVVDGTCLALAPAYHHELEHLCPRHQVSGVLVGAEVRILPPVLVVLDVGLKQLGDDLTLAMTLEGGDELADEDVHGLLRRLDSVDGWELHVGDVLYGSHCVIKILQDLCIEVGVEVQGYNSKKRRRTENGAKARWYFLHELEGNSLFEFFGSAGFGIFSRVSRHFRVFDIHTKVRKSEGT